MHDFSLSRVLSDSTKYLQLIIEFIFNCSFIQDTSVNPSIDFSNLFKIEPLHAPLSPGEKAKAVSITFLARREITIQNQSLLKCQVSTLEILAITCGSIFLSAKNYPVHIQYERYYTYVVSYGPIIFHFSSNYR